MFDSSLPHGKEIFWCHIISNLISKSMPKLMRIEIHAGTKTQRMGNETANPSGPKSPHRVIGYFGWQKFRTYDIRLSGYLMKQKLDE